MPLAHSVVVLALLTAVILLDTGESSTAATIAQVLTATPSFADGLLNSANATASNHTIHPPSLLAHRLLDNRTGMEIGGSSHNPFGLETINVDFTNSSTGFSEEQMKLAGRVVRVDVIAKADELPFANNTYDFLINSHVAEHVYDITGTVHEWMRVVKAGSGYIYLVLPHKERTFDRERTRTRLAEQMWRHRDSLLNGKKPFAVPHYSVWITRDFITLCLYNDWRVVAMQDTDDKVGNGFTVVLRKGM